MRQAGPSSRGCGPSSSTASASWRRATREDATLAARIRHKYRLKNTTGYCLNALVDFTDPIDILRHLMIGSEGTLGFISEITYQTVEEHAHKASALILFDRLETACSAVTRLKQTPVVAVELLDRASLHSVEHKPGMPEGLRALPEDGAALLIETRAATAAALAVKIDAIASRARQASPLFTPLHFATDPAEATALWNVRKGIFPAVGAVRPTGTTVIIEDVAFPIEQLAEASLDLRKLLDEHGYDEAIIFGHALEGNLHFVFTQDFGNAAEIERYHASWTRCARWWSRSTTARSRPSTAPAATSRRSSSWNGARRRSRRCVASRRCSTRRACSIPGVILNADPLAHLKNLKPLPAADPLVDKCIECGFCEPECPSRGLTLSPRQRIVGWREIARLEPTDASPSARPR